MSPYGYADFRLLDAGGTAVATARKQAFCLMDDFDVAQSGTAPRYNCGNQGISVGWADTYAAGLDCEWIDVTDVPAGDYTLQIEIGADHLFAEASYDNNTVSTAVSLAP